MRKLIAGLAMTLDGVVESPSESGWLKFSEDMHEFIAEGTAQADAILLGRRTYLEFAQLWPGGDSQMAHFMNDTPKYVASTTLEAPLEWSGSTLLGGDLGEEVRRLKGQPGANIQIPGSPRLVRSMLEAGLLDELGLLVQPVVIGSGLRLFEGLPESVNLDLREFRTLSTGVLAVTYACVT